MNKTTVLILCAGKQTRWEQNKKFGVKYKQLLPIGDETILSRMIRQCNERGTIPIVAFRNLDLVKSCMKLKAEVLWYHRQRDRWIVETFLSTKPYWQEHTIILLGDVIYSKDLMDRIFAYNGLLTVFGHVYEMYAVSFHIHAQVRYHLTQARKHAEQGGKGTIRMFYQSVCGFTLDRPWLEDKILSHVDYENEWSDDVDAPNDYIHFLNKVVRPGILDDLP